MPTLQRINTENSKQTFPEKELRGHSLNFHIRASVSDLYIRTIDLPIPLQEIGTEAAQFPEKEYINGIFEHINGVFDAVYKRCLSRWM